MQSGLQFFDYKKDFSNVGNRWKKWLQHFKLYLGSERITDPEQKYCKLLFYAGIDILDIYNNLPELSVEDTTKTTIDEKGEAKTIKLDRYEMAEKKLELHFKLKTNVEFEIFNFRNAKQNKGETINAFYSRLLKLSETCDFSDRENEIKYQIIATTTSSRVRDFAFQKKPNLQQLLEEARIFEVAEQQGSAMQHQIKEASGDYEMINYTKTSKNNNRHNKHNDKQQHKQQQQHQQQRNYNHKEKQQSSIGNKQCNFCGFEWHKTGLKDCPARNKRCNKCNRLNHFWRMCMDSKQNSQQQANHIEDKQMESQGNESGSTFNIKNNGKTLPEVTIQLNGLPFTFTIDSGSTTTLISCDEYNKFKVKPILEETKVNIQTYSRETISIVGKFKGRLQHNGLTIFDDIFVVKGDNRSLLSFQASTELKVLQITCAITTGDETKERIKAQYPEIFGKIGKLKNREVHLHIDENVPPVAQSLRRIPFQLRAKLEDELRRLIQSDIIEKVDEPAPWISPVVIVPKANNPDAIRICVDMRAANKAIKRVRHVTPTLHDILIILNGATIFSKIDLNDGYHQLVLDEPSRIITTFSTHCGIYRYKRLNFGINTASEVFQNEIRQILSSIPDVINVSDDILLFGKTQEQHDLTLHKVLQRLRENNITVNDKKCLFNQKEIKFFGFIFTETGFKPDPAKVASFKNMTTPTNASEVRSILGMVNFVLLFLPNLAKHTENLRQLIHKNVEFVWTEKHNKEFDKLKSLMSNAESLSYFNLNNETHVHADAGPKGISAILSQIENNERKIIAYSSRTLTPTEQRYSQIEKEMLAATWAVEHFHVYLFGSKFRLYTDHKALISIIKNPLSRPTARIERFVLRIQQYNFEVFHQNGSTNPADYFSRHPVEETINQTQHIDEYVNFVLNNAIPSAISIETIKSETEMDDFIHSLREAIKFNNWSKLKQYKTISSQFSIVQNCVLKSSCIVIPQKLVNRTIELAHQGHLGMVKTKQLLRTKVWFPNMDKIVEQYIKQCHICQVTTDQHTRAPIQITELTSNPFEKLSLDFAGPLTNGKYLLIIVDDYSRYPFVEIINSTSMANVKPILSMFGIPNIIQTDNGPPFNGHEFGKFAEQCNFMHRKTTPYWPEANGQAERCVKTIKKSLISSYLEDSDCLLQLNIFLMNYRSTPHVSTNFSPYELLFGRRMNNFLPSLQIKKESNDELTSKQQFELNKKQKNKQYADKHRHTREVIFKVGEEVLCKQGRVNKLTPPFDPQPYIITDIKGTQIIAHRGDKRIVRNASFFKKYHRGEKRQSQQTDTDGCKKLYKYYNNLDAIQHKVSGQQQTTRNVTEAETSNISFDEQSDRQDTSQTFIPERPIRTTRGELPTKFKNFKML